MTVQANHVRIQGTESFTWVKTEELTNSDKQLYQGELNRVYEAGAKAISAMNTQDPRQKKDRLPSTTLQKRIQVNLNYELYHNSAYHR